MRWEESVVKLEHCKALEVMEMTQEPKSATLMVWVLWYTIDMAYFTMELHINLSLDYLEEQEKKF